MSAEIRVLQLIDSLNIGGAEVLAVNIANGLVEQHVKSYLCTTRKEGALKEMINSEVGYLFLEKKKKIDLKAFLKLRKYLKVNSINIIHAHSSSFFTASCVKILLPSIKIIWHDHFGDSEFLEERKSKILQLTSYLFSTIISVNNDLKQWAITHLKTKKVIFLRNFPVFTEQKAYKLLKGKEGKRIVHLAGYRPQKDHLNLLKAFSIFIKDNPEWTLHLIGKNYEDEYGKSISNFILNNLELEKSVFEYGVCFDVKQILMQADIGVLSSQSEGLPISLLEYGLAKLSVLVTDVGECKKVVRNNNGIVESNNSEEFARKLTIISRDKNIRNQISNELHQEIISNYSKEIVLNKIIKVYKEIC